MSYEKTKSSYRRLYLDQLEKSRRTWLSTTRFIDWKNHTPSSSSGFPEESEWKSTKGKLTAVQSTSTYDHLIMLNQNIYNNSR
jgi:hypothetical protein